jgi:hypothetical protein
MVHRAFRWMKPRCDKERCRRTYHLRVQSRRCRRPLLPFLKANFYGVAAQCAPLLGSTTEMRPCTFPSRLCSHRCCDAIFTDPVSFLYHSSYFAQRILILLHTIKKYDSGYRPVLSGVKIPDFRKSCGRGTRKCA